MKFGTIDISKICLGGSEISSIYLGTSEVYESGDTPTPPTPTPSPYETTLTYGSLDGEYSGTILTTYGTVGEKVHDSNDNEIGVYANANPSSSTAVFNAIFNYANRITPTSGESQCVIDALGNSYPYSSLFKAYIYAQNWDDSDVIGGEYYPVAIELNNTTLITSSDMVGDGAPADSLVVTSGGTLLTSDKMIEMYVKISDMSGNTLANQSYYSWDIAMIGGAYPYLYLNSIEGGGNKELTFQLGGYNTSDFDYCDVTENALDDILETAGLSNGDHFKIEITFRESSTPCSWRNPWCGQ